MQRKPTTIKELEDNNLIIYEVICGSKAQGLNVPTSDTDKRGIYVVPLKHLISGDYQEQIADVKNDIVYYELGRFIQLAAVGNPTVLELMFTKPEFVLKSTKFFEDNVLNIRNTFITKRCVRAMSGYASEQIRKARGTKKKVFAPMDKKRNTVLDFCYISTLCGTVPLKDWLSRQRVFTNQEQWGAMKAKHARDMYYIYPEAYGFKMHGLVNKAETSNDIKVCSIPKELSVLQEIMIFNKDAYTRHCKDYKQYWNWVAIRNEERFKNTTASGKGYDCKNIMHCVRILKMTLELIKTGKLNVWREDRKELLEIRAGKIEFDDIIQRITLLDEEVGREIKTNTLLPQDIEINIPELITELRTLYYNI